MTQVMLGRGPAKQKAKPWGVGTLVQVTHEYEVPPDAGVMAVQTDTCAPPTDTTMR